MKNDICKANDYHTWSTKEGGMSVDSVSESFDEMDVVFTCQVCGAQAEGRVDWENETE